MNNKGKSVFLNSSSLIDLKAEVLKKRELVTQAKLVRNQSESFSGDTPTRRPGLTKFKKVYDENIKKKYSQKNKIVDAEDLAEENDALKKSRLALERKAKLYEQITSGKHIPAEEEGQLYLVNFEKKVIDKILQQKAEAQEQMQATKENESGEQLADDFNPADIPLPLEPENQWVEYSDNQGRNKCCLQEDLEYFRTVNNSETADGEYAGISKSEKETTSVAEESYNDADDDAPVFYQKLKENEIRLHGVGYYGFSVNPEEREKQMEVLNKLRDQTVTQRENRVKLKEKRKALIKERLAKIKKRKNIAVDDTAGSTSEESDEGGEGAKEETAAEEPEEVIAEEVKEYEKDLKRKLHLRPWDKGKNLTEVSRPGFLSKEAKTLAAHFKWVEERRNDRQEEFAPPQSYT